MVQSLAEARHRLSVALQEQKNLRNEIQELRRYIGLFQKKPDLGKRNAEIYARFEKGESVIELAGQYGLSKGTVQYICDRGDFQKKEK